MASLVTAFVTTGCASFNGSLQSLAQLKETNQLESSTSLNNIEVSPANWPTSNWWERYGDHQLNQLTIEALKDIDSDVDLKQAESAVPVAKQQVTVLKEAVILTCNRLAALMGIIQKTFYFVRCRVNYHAFHWIFFNVATFNRIFEYAGQYCLVSQDRV